MKNSFKIVSVLLLFVVFVVGQSCTELLEQPQPSTSISQSIALTNAGAVRAVRAAMYNRLHSFDYTTEIMIGPSTLADDTFNRAGTNRFSGLAENATGSGLSSYGTAYNMINEANLLINAVDPDVLNPGELDQFRGEALFLRAFAYHHLVRVHGYEPGVTPATGDGNGFNLGVILRTDPVQDPAEANFRPRSTVTAVYNQIRSDLNRAITLLSANDPGSVFFASEASAQALLARVELYARNYTAADNAATAALSASSATLATPSQVETMFNENSGNNPEAIFLTLINPDTESQGVNSSLNTYTTQQWVAQVPTQDFMDTFESGDARLALYAPCFDDVAGVAVTCLGTHPDIMGGNVTLESQKWNGELGSFTDNVPLFRVSEMLLIQSEARLNAGGDAATPLNALRTNRNLGPVAPTMDNILAERRREFHTEGHRFFDLKRLGMDIRKSPENTAPTVPFNSFKVLDDIPQDEVALSQAQVDRGLLSADSVLVQNPGY